MLLGQRITAARQAKGWSRSDLARRAQVDPSYVTRIERAEYGRPSVDKVTAIATALGIRVTDLTEPTPLPAEVANLRATLMSMGFRPNETPLVDRILADLVNRTGRARFQRIEAIATLLSLREAEENE